MYSGTILVYGHRISLLSAWILEEEDWKCSARNGFIHFMAEVMLWAWTIINKNGCFSFVIILFSVKVEYFIEISFVSTSRKTEKKPTLLYYGSLI